MAVLAVVAGAVLMIVFRQRREREPEYQGKRLSEWVGELPYSSTVDRQAQAAQAIHYIGTNAIPYLLQEAHCKDSRSKTALLSLPGWQRLIKVHFKSDSERHLAAIHAFACLGLENKTATIQALAPFLDDPDLTICVVVTLLDIAPRSSSTEPWDLDILPLISKAMTNSNLSVRVELIPIGSEIYPNQKLLIPALISCSKDQDFMVRALAVKALGQFSQFPEEVIPVLTRRLQDEMWRVQLYSANALCSFGGVEASKQAVPALVNALGDRDADIRKAAARALSIIAPETLKKQ